MADRELCTINEACALMHVSRRTIYNWMKRDLVETCVTPSGTTRIYTDSLIQKQRPVWAIAPCP